MAEAPQGALMDLEKELSCSICTDVLYQPLTLLDCLHTFCGACLKEWFSLQAQSATTLHPYTCPSCRASVRATQPNATVTTLLDMFLHANPGRGKTDEEKEDMRKIYKPGDNVMPRLRRRRHDSDDEEDRRLMDEIRQLSLQEVGVSGGTLSLPFHEHGRRERSGEHRDGDDRRRRARDGSTASRNAQGTGRSASPRPPRHVEHQSSLRSLLSASDFDSQEMEEEIMRQIREEGLLDGIDLENINVSQEEEITERIAQAFRRRQRERERARTRHERSRSASANSAARQSQEEDRPQRRQRSRAESGATQQASQSQSSRPPVSRPHLFDAVNEATRHHRRSSSQGSSHSARRQHNPRGLSIDATTRSAARSATDLSNRHQATQGGAEVERQRRPSRADRRVTDPERHHHVNEAVSARPVTGSNENSPRRTAFGLDPTASPPLGTPPAAANAHAALRQFAEVGSTIRHGRPTNNSSPSLVRPHGSSDPTIPDARPSSSSGASGSRPSLFPEPSVSCNRCGKTHIEYDLHYNCRKCHDGKYNLCLRCYRAGEGCLHWYGFGSAAWARYERRAPEGGYLPDHEQPHILAGHRYNKPRKEPVHAPSAKSHAPLTEEDPAQRLQSGVFCDICSAFANGCYWKCDTCNEGAWGFCNECVNQGRHCTHALLPLQHRTRNSNSGANTSSTPSSPALSAQPPLTPKSASLIRGPGTHTLANLLFRPLTFSTLCDICAYPIPPSHTRFHCPTCNAGNSDICTSCYHGLVVSGRIASENGHNGWRRCPRGHRMVVVGFEDRDAGQRRVVTRDLVGGRALKEDDGPTSPTSRAAGSASNSNSDVLGTPNWSWKDTDGTVQKARSRTTSLTTSSSSSSASAMPRRSNSGSGGGAGGSSSSKRKHPFPPDGGVGLRAVALWGYWPGEDVNDELMFPKGAEIIEAEDINGDWFWGCYAGRKGLFPGNYVKVL